MFPLQLFLVNFTLTMPKLRYISRPLIKMVYKMKHHRGHGIHSPFLFSLITKVIEEKNPYYAYTDIDVFLETYPTKNRRSTKLDRLLFRIVNYFSAKSILEIGAKSGIGVLYLTAPSSNICYHSAYSRIRPTISEHISKYWKRDVSFSSELCPIDQKQDCIVIDMRGLQANYTEIHAYVSSLIHEESFLILKNIRTNKEANSLWRQFRSDTRTTMSLHLYNTGILFFNPKLYRRNYIISF